MEVKGIFVIKNGKDNAVSKIDALSKKYSSKTSIHSGSNAQQITTFKAYCHDAVEVMKDCFEMEMWGISRCKRFVEQLSTTTSGTTTILQYAMQVFDVLIGLREIAKTSIPIKDMPSCKALSELSIEDAIAVSKDLVQNDIIKAIAGALLLGKKLGDAFSVTDIRSYYSDMAKELNEEIASEKRPISPIEQFLMDKYEAEIGYCDLALIKISATGLSEVVKLKELAEKNIAKYERRGLDNKILAMPTSI